MAATPIQKERGPPAWDKPLAVVMIIAAVVIVLYFLLNFPGPTTAGLP